MKRSEPNLRARKAAGGISPAAATLVFRVNHGSWQAGKYGPYTDTAEIEKPSRELVRLAAHAHAAGVLTVSHGLELKHVQTQADGEKAHAKAVKDGRWHEGHQAQLELGGKP